MTKILRVTLDIPVVELPEDEQQEMRDDLDLGSDDEDGEEGSDFFSVESYDASELAEVLEGAFYDEAVREMFAGSNMYVRFGEDVAIVAAEWKE
jgi:hypothetical protein